MTMTFQADETTRSEFEAWLNPGAHDGNVSAWIAPGRYEKESHQLAWLAWQAARAQPSRDASPRLLELADRIDHDKLCLRAGLERAGWTQEQRDRCDAGVHLRRYADLLGSGCWRLYPPNGIPTRFSADTLDKVIAMAKREETRR